MSPTFRTLISPRKRAGPVDPPAPNGESAVPFSGSATREPAEGGPNRAAAALPSAASHRGAAGVRAGDPVWERIVAAEPASPFLGGAPQGTPFRLWFANNP